MNSDYLPIQPEDEAAGFNIRMLELEQRIEDMSRRVDSLVNQVARLSRINQSGNAPAAGLEPVSGAADGQVIEHDPPVQPPAGKTPFATEISMGMARVIQLLSQGDGEAAQHKLHNLPEEELSSQPAVVALVAAALFVQRGDYTSGLKAVKRARQLTDDERLIRLTQLLEQQATR